MALPLPGLTVLAELLPRMLSLHQFSKQFYLRVGRRQGWGRGKGGEAPVGGFVALEA